MKGLHGKVALVMGGGQGVAKSIALRLASHGVRVVVAGPEERAIGETVGEIVYGGGAARHTVCDPLRFDDLERAVQKALTTFGALDIAVAGPAALDVGQPRAGEALADGTDLAQLTDVSCVLRAVAPRLSEDGRVCLLTHAVDAADVSVTVASRELCSRRITCNEVALWRGSQSADCDGTTDADGEADEEAERVAMLVVSLCSAESAGVTGERSRVGYDGERR